MKTYALVIARNIIIVAIFTQYFTACDLVSGLFDWSIPTRIHVKSLEDAEKKLAKHTFNGDSPDDPVDVHVNFEIGDLSQPNNDYLRLIEIIGNSGLYAELSLGSSTINGTTVFTSPSLNEAVKGMDKIVSINVFPSNTTSIMADENEKSPFFYYENLIRVVTSGKNFTNISDYAFSSCKSLERVDLYDVKTIGREAFHGCENLRGVNLPAFLETIDDKAFFDCSSLEWLGMPRNPPTLGDDVFLGSTPSTLRLSVERENLGLYRAWLAENASKFNNNGEDVVFKVWD